MLPTRFPRVRISKLALISIFIVFVAIALVWTTGQQAGASARKLLGSSAVRLDGADKGGITPEAVTIVVNSTSDVANGSDGLCTLREAIVAASDHKGSGATAGECPAGGNGGSDTIDLTGLTGTINVATALPPIQTATVNIIGPGASVLTVQRSTASGTPNFTIFRMLLPNFSGAVNLSGLTIANGFDPVASGGGIQISGGNNNTINVTDCIITGNLAFQGAGISHDSTSTLNVINTSIRNNSSPGSAKGGAAIFNGASGGKVNVINSTLNDNTTPNGGGGAIYNRGVMTITNSTITNNSSLQGGGIYNESGTVDINNVTIARNTVGAGHGGGVFNSGGFRTRNSIIALNTGGTGTDFDTFMTSQGHNLIGVSETNGVVPASGDLIGTTGSPINPQLGTLQNNGGPTQTLALLSGSPALDAGDDCVTQASHCGDAKVTQLTTDQRGTGFGRQVDGPDGDTTATVDIGAYEMQTSLANLPDTSTNEDTQKVITFEVANASSLSSVTSSDPTVVPNDAAHLSATLTGTTGVVTINPATDANGPTNITVTVNLVGGGTATKTFLLTVNPVNDVPSFTKGPDQTVNEDAGAQSVSNWATAISKGAANESGQALTFQVTGNTNAALFSAGPSISSTGTLTYTPAANANGSATITINLKDDGGTANGGVDTSASQTFTITVNSVNDVPSFTKGADQTVNNNAGAQTVTNWATNILAGPSNESGQTLTFQFTGNTNPGLFTSGPAVSSSGTLTYTPSSSGGGTATLTINLKDNGGTANGGVDTSAAQTFTITVTPVGGFVNFASSAGNTTENSGTTTVNVVRTGDTSKAVTVNYATNADTGVPCSTANGVASPKCDFTAALGTLSFAAGETSKPITILISQDSFVEGPETITLTLSSPTGGAALGTPSSMAVTIADDASEPPSNIIDDPNMFVRMHYHDFLNREADQSGLDFWTGQMTNCGNSDLTVCRVNVSGAFFLSIEFQQTGYLVERMYKTGYGDATGTSQLGGSHQIFVPVVRANEFLADTQRVGRGVVVGQTGWETVLENNKQAYLLEFVQTSRFITAFPTSMTPAQFVDKLNTNAGNVLSASERTTAINLFGNAATTTNVTARAQALRQVAEDQDLYNAEFSRAFVLTEYIGYLRRNPNDAPESTLDYSGYDFWLGKLNQFNGDYLAAEMVKAFISSGEYRQRFGP